MWSGPYDHTRRFTYWVERIAAGGEVLAPEPRDYQIQVIDARDQASWAIDMIERRARAPSTRSVPNHHSASTDMLNAIVEAVGPEGTTLTWVDGCVPCRTGR